MRAWKNSECKNRWFHRFQIVWANSQGTMEQCEICHKRKFFRTLDGKSNNIEYLSYHIRQALPPWHNLFSREYNK